MPELPVSLLSSFPGTLHPALVHLPIGILCFATVLDGWCRLTRRHDFHPSLVLLYITGACCAWLSVATGWLLANGGDYAGDEVYRHRWMGVVTAVAATVCAWWIASGRFPETGKDDHTRKGKWTWMLVPSAGLLLLILLTGHWGGSITHGEGYLLKGLPGFPGSDGDTQQAMSYQVDDPAKALAYQDITNVMLTQKCVSCHGPQKQKGKLRLDRADFLFQGGKHGEVVVAGQPGESELLRRLLLPMDDDEHMPPKEKPQLTAEEIAYLHWWISAGADTAKSIAALTPPDSLGKVLRFFQGKGKEAIAVPEQLPEPAGEARPTLLDSLEKRGLLLLPISRESRNLEVSFLNTRDSADELLRLLEPLAPFIVHLDLAGKACSDKGLGSVGKLTRLHTLNLSGTRVSDKGMPLLAGLQELEKLNLSGTAVTAKGFQAMGKLQGLRAIYLFQAGLGAADLTDLQTRYPGVIFDTGGYRLPPTDSVKR